MPQINSLFCFDSTDEPTSDNSTPEMDTEFAWEDPLGATPLHHACFFSFVGEEKVKELLEGGADPNARDKRGLTALHYLVLSAQGRVEKAALLLEKGVSLSLQEEDGQSTLGLAVKMQKVRFILYFLCQGADPDELEGYDLNQLDSRLGVSLLHLACLKGGVVLVKSLLDRGGDLAVKTSQNQTPLHLAVQARDFSLTKFLLDEGAWVNDPGERGIAPLHLAMHTGEKKFVELLLSKGADVDQQDDKGWSALHWAAYKGSLGLVYLLMESYGGDPFLKDHLGKTPCEVAVEQGHHDLLPLLGKRGESGGIVLSQERLRAILNEAISTQDPQKMEELLSFVESIPEVFGTIGGYNRETLCQTLLQTDFDLNKEERGNNPLHLAIYKKDHRLIRHLVYLGMDLNFQNHEGRSALHLACSKEINDYDVAKFLLKLGANPNLQDRYGNTPHHLSIMSAAHFADYQISGLLIDFGVDLNLKDKEDCTSAEIYYREVKYPESREKIQQRYHFYRKLYQGGMDLDRPLLSKLVGKGQLVIAKRPRPIHLALFFDTKKYGLPFSFLEVLVENGADINIQDDMGQTALHLLLRFSRFSGIESPLDKTRYLLENGADPTIKDFDGWSPRKLLSTSNVYSLYNRGKYIALFQEWESKTMTSKK